jgi:putative hydrolase of the HAD superfamily
MTGPTILWDFDGTLAYRPRRWGGAMIEALDSLVPGHSFTAADTSPHLRSGFPWHAPDVPHPELSDPAAWWARLDGVLRHAYSRLGIGDDLAGRLAAEARTRYVDPASYSCFEDTRPVLEALGEDGWRHVVLSNHVPELSDIVRGVGLWDLVDHVITSAHTGFEKPHTEAYAIARRAAGDPETLWMIGDNPVADVQGAEAVGIPAILVRTAHPDVERRAEDLHAARTFLE